MPTGKLGSEDLTAATDVLLATAAEPMVVNIRLACRLAATTAGAKVRLAIGTGATPANKDYLEYDTPLPGGQALEATAVALSIGEKIWVRSDVAGVSARAHGVPAA